MLRSKAPLAWVCLIAGACAGCAGKKGQTVYVDVDSLLPAAQASVRAEAQTPPVPSSESVHRLPGMAAETLHAQDQARLDSVKKLIQTDRANAQAELTARLAEVYRAEAARLAKERFGDPAANESAAMAGAREKIYEAFVKYAAARGPLLAQLSLIVGFPDPDPQSSRVPPADRVVAAKRFDEAKQLRADISKLDAAYLADTNQILQSTRDEVELNLVQARQQIQKMKDEADQRAAAEAAAQLAGTAKNIEIDPSTIGEVQLGAANGSGVRIQNPSVAGTRVSAPMTEPGASRAEAKRRLQEELGLWLAQNDYRLADRKAGARDATKEFEAWLTEMGLGR